MSNPAVTFRVSPEDLRKLERLEKRTGQSRGRLLRENLGIAERDADGAFERGHSTGWDEGYEAGRKQGFEEGKKTFAIGYYCNVCKKPIPIRSDSPLELRQAIVDDLYRRKWGHNDCHNAPAQRVPAT
jgi:flagellar biosynthesis/type III secretory pathway protein FliH